MVFKQTLQQEILELCCYEVIGYCGWWVDSRKPDKKIEKFHSRYKNFKEHTRKVGLKKY